jgi:thiol-disulfide isomerase/thioredoxin
MKRSGPINFSDDSSDFTKIIDELRNKVLAVDQDLRKLSAKIQPIRDQMEVYENQLQKLKSLIENLPKMDPSKMPVVHDNCFCPHCQLINLIFENTEKEELVYLEVYLPQMMSFEDVKKIVEAKKFELDINDAKDKGKLMSEIMKDLKGKAEGMDVKNAVDSLF